MEQQSKPSWLDKSTKALALLGFLLALFSVGWQVYTYRESHEESPMVRASLTVPPVRIALLTLGGFPANCLLNSAA
jgi:hypothetical protein